MRYKSAIVIAVGVLFCAPFAAIVAHGQAGARIFPVENRTPAGCSNLPAIPEPVEGSGEVMYKKPSNYTQLVSWYSQLESHYPDYIHVFKANDLYGTGKIEGGYDDYYVRLTNSSLGFHKPELLFLGGPHGDETAGTISLYWFCDWFLRHAYNSSFFDMQTPYLRRLADCREIYIEVSHNPFGFDRETREDRNGTDLNREADFDGPGAGAPDIFVTANGKTLREFINHHQVRIGTDFHGGARMMLYPWASVYQNASGISPISGRNYSYAPPDFYYFDSTSLRCGSFMGNAGGNESYLNHKNTGTIPDCVGYNCSGNIASWAYGSDTGSNPVEAKYVKHPPYPGVGIMWLGPEVSDVKNPVEPTFGGDDTQGLGSDIRRFILHCADLAQPYLVWQPGTLGNDSTAAPGESVTFRWQVNGSMVVEHTSVQWGNSPDPINNYTAATIDNHTYAGKYTGGTGWEGAQNGTIATPVTYTETIALSTTPGDYYFVAKAQVDQIYNATLQSPEYENNHTYLRLLKERIWDGWKEEINGTDGKEVMSGKKWWYSPVIHIRVGDPVPESTCPLLALCNIAGIMTAVAVGATRRGITD